MVALRETMTQEDYVQSMITELTEKYQFTEDNSVKADIQEQIQYWQSQLKTKEDV